MDPPGAAGPASCARRRRMAHRGCRSWAPCGSTRSIWPRPLCTSRRCTRSATCSAGRIYSVCRRSNTSPWRASLLVRSFSSGLGHLTQGCPGSLLMRAHRATARTPARVRQVVARLHPHPVFGRAPADVLQGQRHIRGHTGPCHSANATEFHARSPSGGRSRLHSSRHLPCSRGSAHPSVEGWPWGRLVDCARSWVRTPLCGQW